MRYLLLVVLLITVSCSSKFVAEDTVPVGSGVTLGELQIVESDAGVLFKWFGENNYWTDAEQAEVAGMYSEMIRIVKKLRQKTIAGQTDYHRLLYAMEDLTEVWADLRPELQDVVDTVKPAQTLEDELAISMWNRVKVDMDSTLQSANVLLKHARDGMDEATYAAFKKDAQGILKTLTPLLSKATGLF